MKEKKTVQREVKTATEKSREDYKDKTVVRLTSGDMCSERKKIETMIDVPIERSTSDQAL